MTLPPKGSFITNEIDAQFIENVDKLIADFGRTVKVHKTALSINCPNCFYDKARKRSANRYNTSNPNPSGSLNKFFATGTRCPVCVGVGKLNQTPQSDSFIAVIIKSTKEMIELEKELSLRLGSVVETISESEHTDIIFNAEKATIDGFLYKRISEPTKLGLSTQAYVKAFWAIQR